MNSEQLTVYAQFIHNTTICATREDIKVIDKSTNTHIHIYYEGQEFHYDNDEVIY